MEETLSIQQQTKDLIDRLKSTTSVNGLGNSGNEYVVIVQTFLYKFLNDKFIYTAKKEMPELVEDGKDILSKEDYLALGLNGSTDAALKREYLGKLYHIGKCNAKTFYKRLNMLKIDKEKIVQDLKGMGI